MLHKNMDIQSITYRNDQ